MQTIGKYEVEKVLGRGGMGTVYQARDPVIHRTVALKTMTPGVADTPELKARFLREAQAAGGLRHHNIVTVYDLGEDRGQPFIAMELVEGQDLEKIIQGRQPLSVEWKIDVLRQVCEGLAYAHRAGIVHRDVKPANIRVTSEGEVKIMDFGIAHLASSTMTKSGAMLGTVHYMAPEQVEGEKIDHRADIFSVGAIAYELLAYRRPFDADSLTQVMFRIVRESPDMTVLPPTEYSPGLEAIVSRALAKPLAERYQDLDEMRDDLERLVRETAARLLAAQPRTGLRAGRSGRRDRAGARGWPSAEGAHHVSSRAGARPGTCRRPAALPGGRGGHPGPGSRAALGHGPRLCRGRRPRPGHEDREQGGPPGPGKRALPRPRRLPRRGGGPPLGGRARRTAQEHIVLGNLEEARAAAEKVLATQPDHAIAREIRDRAGVVIEQRNRPSLPLTPEGQAALDARRSEAAADAAAALDHFLRNDHARARKSVEKALSLDPENRRAEELRQVLGILG